MCCFVCIVPFLCVGMIFVCVVVVMCLLVVVRSPLCFLFFFGGGYVACVGV